MKKYMKTIVTLFFLMLSVSTVEASIVSNQGSTVYIGGASPPDIKDDPSNYFLTISDASEVIPQVTGVNSNYPENDGTRTCKPETDNNGNYIGYSGSGCESRKIYQGIDFNYIIEGGSGTGRISTQIMTLKPTTEYTTIFQNVKDYFSIIRHYNTNFENLPGLGDEAFYLPKIDTGGGTSFGEEVVVRRDNIILIVDGYGDKNQFIQVARKYLSKISQVRSNQPNLIIQAIPDKTVLEVGTYSDTDRFNIEFKATNNCWITVKNNGNIIDSFVLIGRDSRNYRAEKADGIESLDISAIDSKGKTDFTTLSFTTKLKPTPTPYQATETYQPQQTYQAQQVPSSDAISSLSLIIVILIVWYTNKRR